MYIDGDSCEGNEHHVFAGMIIPENPISGFNASKETPTSQPQFTTNYASSTVPHTDTPHENMPPYYCMYYIIKK